MSRLKDLLSNWKVSVTLVGGALVIASVWGKCSLELPTSDSPASDEVPVEGADVETEPVSNETNAQDSTDEAGTTEETTDSTTESTSTSTSD